MRGTNGALTGVTESAPNNLWAAGYSGTTGSFNPLILQNG